jgi:hypothetical protein
MMSGMYGVLSEIAIRDGGAKLLKGLVSLMVRHRASPVSGDIVPEPPERGPDWRATRRSSRRIEICRIRIERPAFKRSQRHQTSTIFRLASLLP